MEPPFPSLTLTWHNDVYPAIEYTNKSLSHKGETVVITGAGSGIGRETAIGFATAGAKHLVLVGRNISKLRETQSLASKANAEIGVSVFATDVTDEIAVKNIADNIISWNVFVHCAGYIHTAMPAAQAEIQDYWASYEVNVKSTIVLVKYLLPKANPTNAAVLCMTAGGISFPTKMLVGLSGYLASKLAVSKTMEFLAHENPDIFFASIHPGNVDTDIFRKSEATPDMVPMDTPQLAAGFSLWVSKPEARFLNGKTLWSNWDIDELKGMQEEFSSGPKLTYGLNGWPFSAS
ncbi:hypothetical protein DL769_003869 [Monosporascus sp. CRB-8-3]|nr:hypothetical protein DL769_003869 [Monosporascus sp. CRB-8-3]